MDYTTIIDTEWENADSTFNNQNKSELSGIMPFIPIIIAGVLAIYGLIYSVLQAVTSNDYNTSRGHAQFVGGLELGFTCICWYCRKEDFMPFLKTNHHHSDLSSISFTVKLWDFMALSLPLLLRLLSKFPLLPGSPVKMATILFLTECNCK